MKYLRFTTTIKEFARSKIRRMWFNDPKLRAEVFEYILGIGIGFLPFPVSQALSALSLSSATFLPFWVLCAFLLGISFVFFAWRRHTLGYGVLMGLALTVMAIALSIPNNTEGLPWHKV